MGPSSTSFPELSRTDCLSESRSASVCEVFLSRPKDHCSCKAAGLSTSGG